MLREPFFHGWTLRRTCWAADGAPFRAESVLIVDPVTRVSDIDALGRHPIHSNKWVGIAYAPNTGCLCTLKSPPRAVGTSRLGPCVFEGNSAVPRGPMHCRRRTHDCCVADGAPYNATSVLVVNPLTNVTDTTVMQNLGDGTAKWIGIAYAPNVGKLCTFNPPCCDLTESGPEAQTLGCRLCTLQR